MNTKMDDTIPADILEAAMMLPQAMKDKLTHLILESLVDPPIEIASNEMEGVSR